MEKSLLVNTQPDNIKKAEKYIFKYLKELKIHFNLSNQQLANILIITAAKIKRKSFKNIWFSLFKK